MLITNIITATLTAYCSCKLCCGPNAKGICANNKPPIEGRTVAASRRIPLNSRVGIGTKIYAVTDRMHRKYDKEYRFDIYFTKHSDAKKFGIKTNQTVTIVTTK